MLWLTSCFCFLRCSGSMMSAFESSTSYVRFLDFSCAADALLPFSLNRGRGAPTWCSVMVERATRRRRCKRSTPPLKKVAQADRGNSSPASVLNQDVQRRFTTQLLPLPIHSRNGCSIPATHMYRTLFLQGTQSDPILEAPPKLPRRWPTGPTLRPPMYRPIPDRAPTPLSAQAGYLFYR